jgi:hypothetical protein
MRARTVDLPPLYPTETEIAKLVLGAGREKDWPAIASTLEKRGLPRIDPLMRGRYLPAVLTFLDRLHGIDEIHPTKNPAEKEDWTWLEDRRSKRRG